MKNRKSLLFVLFNLITSLAFATPKQIANLKRIVELTIEENKKAITKIDSEISDFKTKTEKKEYFEELSKDLNFSTTALISVVLTKTNSNNDYVLSLQKDHKKYFNKLNADLEKTQKCFDSKRSAVRSCVNSIFNCDRFGKKADGSLYANTLDYAYDVTESPISNFEDVNQLIDDGVKEEEKPFLSRFSLIVFNICSNDLKNRSKPKAITISKDIRSELYKIENSSFDSCKDNYQKQRDASSKLFPIRENVSIKFHYNSISSAIDVCRKTVSNFCSHVTIGTKYDFYTFQMEDCTAESYSSEELKEKINSGYERNTTKEIFASALERIEMCKPAKEIGFTWWVDHKQIAKDGCKTKTSKYSSSNSGSYCTRYCSRGKACGNSCIASWKNCYQPPGTACDI